VIAARDLFALGQKKDIDVFLSLLAHVDSFNCSLITVNFVLIAHQIASLDHQVPTVLNFC
jgi:hypothetical protein